MTPPPPPRSRYRWLYITLALTLGLVILTGVGGYVLRAPIKRQLLTRLDGASEELVVSFNRSDTKRLDRWRLNLPGNYVLDRRPGSDLRPSSYVLGLLPDSGHAAASEVAIGWLRGRKTADVLADAIRVSIGQVPIQSPPDSMALYEYRHLERDCAKGTAAFGLNRYEIPSDKKRSECADEVVSIFAAGGAPDRYDVVIQCALKADPQNAEALSVCSINTLDMLGWSVVLEFDSRLLPRWRAVVRQSMDFLQAHTVESTTGLPSTELGWMTPDKR